MALVRKIRKVGHSLTVVIPAHLAAMVDFEEGDEIEFDHIGDGSLRLRKMRE